MPFDVLARGDDWVVVHKPSGVLVHRQPGVREDAAVQIVRNQVGRRVWPVHRLDRATSGCLLFALEHGAIAGLHDALGRGSKRYLAQVRGNLAADEPFVVDAPLKVNGKEKSAATRFTKLGGASEPRSSLVLAEPRTGRYHQIRRHLVRLSHPVLGDSTHGDTRVNRTWRKEHGLHRLALHCWTLRLDLPDGTPLSVTAPPPDELMSVWVAQPWWDRAHETLNRLPVEAAA